MGDMCSIAEARDDHVINCWHSPHSREALTLILSFLCVFHSFRIPLAATAYTFLASPLASESFDPLFLF